MRLVAVRGAYGIGEGKRGGGGRGARGSAEDDREGSYRAASLPSVML